MTTFHEEITSVATSAVQEGVLEEMMGKVSTMWAKTEFEVGCVRFGPEHGCLKKRISLGAFCFWYHRFFLPSSGKTNIIRVALLE